MRYLRCASVALLAILAPVMVSEAVPNRVTTGLVGEWKQATYRSSSSNDLVYDTSGLGQTGVVYPNRALSAGWWDSGINLGGENYVQMNNSPNLNFGTGSFTLAAWVRMKDTHRSLKTLIENRGTDGRGYSFAVYGGDKLVLKLADETGWSNYLSNGTRLLAPNRWHHVAVSVNRTSKPASLTFYIDGYEAGSASPKTGNINNTNLPFYIGGNKDLSSARFNDLVDEVLVYNRALSGWDIVNVLNPGRPHFTPNYWNSTDVQRNNNCYNYANNKATNTFAQPGNASGGQASAMDCEAVKQAAINDGLEPIPGPPSGVMGSKTGVALVVAPGYDYHWYRLDENGRWTHKPGQTPATHLDNAGNEITDPRTANRGPYSDFCGFFLLWSDVTEGYGHETIQ